MLLCSFLTLKSIATTYGQKLDEWISATVGCTEYYDRYIKAVWQGKIVYSHWMEMYYSDSNVEGVWWKCKSPITTITSNPRCPSYRFQLRNGGKKCQIMITFPQSNGYIKVHCHKVMVIYISCVIFTWNFSSCIDLPVAKL